MNLPVADARQVGFYYQALALNAKGRSNEAQCLLQMVAENAPTTYRSRAMHTLGLVHLNRGQLDDSMQLSLKRRVLDRLRGSRSDDTNFMAHFNIVDHQEYITAIIKKLYLP